MPSPHTPHQLELVAQRGFAAAQLGQRDAQVPHQAGDRIGAGIRLRAVQPSQVAEHVEQEMRLDLGLQKGQLLLRLVVHRLRTRRLRRRASAVDLQCTLMRIGDQDEEDGGESEAQRLGQDVQERRQMREALSVIAVEQEGAATEADAGASTAGVAAIVRWRPSIATIASYMAACTTPSSASELAGDRFAVMVRSAMALHCVTAFCALAVPNARSSRPAAQ